MTSDRKILYQLVYQLVTVLGGGGRILYTALYTYLLQEHPHLSS